MTLLDRAIAKIVNSDGALHGIAKRYAWCMPVVAILGFLASLLEGVGLSLLIPLLSTLSSAPVSTGSAFLNALFRVPDIFPAGFRLAGIGLIMLAAILLKGLFQATSDMLVAWVEGRAGHELRSIMAERLLRVPYPYFQVAGQVRLVNAISTESWRAIELARSGYATIGAVATIVVFSALLIATSWWLFAVMAVGAVLIRLAQSSFNKRVAAISEALRTANLGLSERMVMVAFDMIKLARLFNRQADEIRKFDAASDAVRREITRLAFFGAWIGPISEQAYAILFLGILFGAYGLGVALPVLITFLALMYRMQPQIRVLAAAGVSLVSISASIREVDWLIRTTDEQPPEPGTLPFPGLREGLRFDRVSFDYGEMRSDGPTIHNRSFTISAGRWTAILGPSGVGKSTVVNLISKLLTPTSGRILVDDVDLATIAPEAWREHIAAAGQDLELVEGSIVQNIRMGRDDATDEEVAAVGHIVGLDRLIAEMPAGYQTAVGERGRALSGGQRQRVGLARALIRRPSLLILDEATNAIDAASEAELMGRIHDGFPELTVVVISHRESTLALCTAKVDLDRSVGATSRAAPAAEMSDVVS